jgi:uncharacterized membrane protein YbaN (DUF454 family)
LDGDANFTRLNARLDLSIWHFQRSFHTYKRPLWQTPVLRRCISENRRVGGLLMRIGDANFTRLNARLNLSIWRFQRSFYTYKRPFWQTLVLRRCISENRRVGGLLMRIGDANFTRLNARLNLSIWRFQRRFYTYRRQFWQAPVVRRFFLKEQAFMSSTTVMCHQRWLHCF